MMMFFRFVLLFRLLHLQLSCSLVSATLVASVILPHGDFAWDPTLATETIARKAAHQVASAARSAGAWLSKTIHPDLILLSTPHGISVSHDWVFYLGSHASGHADIGQDVIAPDHKRKTIYRIRTAVDLLAPNMTQEFLDFLKPQAVTGLSSFADSEDMPLLRWGEVIPLLLLNNNHSSPTTTILSSLPIHKQPRFIILSHPLRRHTQAQEMIPELLQLGHSLRQWADASPLRVAMLISADLSHRHLANGPYGYSNTSRRMDAALGRWASHPWLHADELLVTAAGLQHEALACGFTGMVLLHGALVGVGDDNEEQQQQWTSRVWVNRNVTYYGMMVATFEISQQHQRASIDHAADWNIKR